MRILNSSSQQAGQGAGSIQRSGSGASSAASARAHAGLDSSGFDQVLERRVQESPEARPSQASKEPGRGGLERRNDDTSRSVKQEIPVERHASRPDARPRESSRPEREDRGHPGRHDHGPAQSDEPASESPEEASHDAVEDRVSVLGMLQGLGGVMLPDLHAVLGATSNPAGGGGSGGSRPFAGAMAAFSAAGAAVARPGEHLGALTAGPRPSTEALRAHPVHALMAGAELTQALAATGLAGAGEDGNLGILDQNTTNPAAAGTDPATQSTRAPSADASAQASREQKPLQAERAAQLEAEGEGPEALDGTPIVLEIQASQGDGEGQSGTDRGLEQRLQGGEVERSRLTQQLQQDSAVAFGRELDAQSARGASEAAPGEAPGWITRLRGAVEQGLASRDDQLSARVELDDPELGRIRLELHLEGGKVRVELVAEREQTRQMLKDGRQALEQELARHQQELAQFSVGGEGARDSRGFGKFQDNSRRVREAGGEARAISSTDAAPSKGRRLHEGQLDIIA